MADKAHCDRVRCDVVDVGHHNILDALVPCAVEAVLDRT